MSLVILGESIRSGQRESGSDPSRVYVVLLTGVDNATAAEAGAIAYAPNRIDNLVINDISTVQQGWQVGNELWEVTLNYGRLKDKETGESLYSFEITGTTKHITQALSTVSATAAVGVAPNYGGAIGVTVDAVEGVEIFAPESGFSETWYVPAASVTANYKTKLEKMLFKMNQAAFRDKARGECLFMGANGQQRSEEDWEITFKFAVSENAVNIPIAGGAIVVPEKLGWDYLWVSYGETFDDVAQRRVKKPIAAYVERVYKFANFGDLGIG